MMSGYEVYALLERQLASDGNENHPSVQENIIGFPCDPNALQFAASQESSLSTGGRIAAEKLMKSSAIDNPTSNAVAGDLSGPLDASATPSTPWSIYDTYAETHSVRFLLQLSAHLLTILNGCKNFLILFCSNSRYRNEFKRAIGWPRLVGVASRFGSLCRRLRRKAVQDKPPALEELPLNCMCNARCAHDPHAGHPCPHHHMCHHRHKHQQHQHQQHHHMQNQVERPRCATLDRYAAELFEAPRARHRHEEPSVSSQKQRRSSTLGIGWPYENTQRRQQHSFASKARRCRHRIRMLLRRPHNYEAGTPAHCGCRGAHEYDRVFFCRGALASNCCSVAGDEAGSGFGGPEGHMQSAEASMCYIRCCSEDWKRAACQRSNRREADPQKLYLDCGSACSKRLAPLHQRHSQSSGEHSCGGSGRYERCRHEASVKSCSDSSSALIRCSFRAAHQANDCAARASAAADVPSWPSPDALQENKLYISRSYKACQAKGQQEAAAQGAHLLPKAPTPAERRPQYACRQCAAGEEDGSRRSHVRDWIRIFSRGSRSSREDRTSSASYPMGSRQPVNPTTVLAPDSSSLTCFTEPVFVATGTQQNLKSGGELRSVL